MWTPQRQDLSGGRKPARGRSDSRFARQVTFASTAADVPLRDCFCSAARSICILAMGWRGLNTGGPVKPYHRLSSANRPRSMSGEQGTGAKKLRSANRDRAPRHIEGSSPDENLNSGFLLPEMFARERNGRIPAAGLCGSLRTFKLARCVSFFLSLFSGREGRVER